MKKIVLTVATLSLLTLGACGPSTPTPGKQAITPRKVDTSKKVEMKAGGSLNSKEGADPASTKKGP
ncbi:MAG: hypothetical protein DWI18_01200 [Planctomycetota bacterium]|nr:MAG: hypothetical protein DWI18_01200 [Planctomycetota bacterium]